MYEVKEMHLEDSYVKITLSRPSPTAASRRGDRGVSVAALLMFGALLLGACASAALGVIP